MKFAMIAVSVIVVIGLIIFTMGMLAAKDHKLSLSRDYPIPVTSLYQLVRDYEAYPGWRTGIKSMQKDGELRYIEESAHGKIPYRIIEDTGNQLIISKIDDPSLPFSGTWTFEFSDKNGHSQLRITEAGSVPNPLMRFFATYVFSHEKTMQTYLDDVERKFKQKT